MATTNVAEAQPGDIFIDFAQQLTPAIAAAAAAAGVDGVMQYTPYTVDDRPKYGSAAEAQIAIDHGLYYMLNWEIESDRALQGYDVGRSDGARNRQALRAMGYPEEVSAPVSVDMNTLLANKDAVSGFVRGHWETDGDQAENIAYLDTDGGRVLDQLGLDPHIWIPGAYAWSPELYALSRSLQTQGLTQSARYDRIATLAAESPMAVAIQFPSTTAFGIGVDFNRVLHPFKVWGNARTDRPALITTGDDMAVIITCPDPGCNPFLLDGGYTTGVDETSLNTGFPTLPVAAGVWHDLVAISDGKKAADAAMGKGVTVNAGPVTGFTGTINLTPSA